MTHTKGSNGILPVPCLGGTPCDYVSMPQESNAIMIIIIMS